MRKKQYAQQLLYLYGWDYVGVNERGGRLLFDTREEAENNLKTGMVELMKIGYFPNDWRIVEYVEAEDNKTDLYL